MVQNSPGALAAYNEATAANTNCESGLDEAKNPFNNNHATSNPTLSYTQRLESQVRRLKTLLVQALGTLPPDVDVGDDSATQYVDEDAMVTSDGFESLTVSNTGQVSFHGPTSFARLPSISSRKSIDNGTEGPLRLTERERVKWRERLVSNALQQRVLEGSFDTPVSTS